jgi:protein-disulfide isomerase
VTTSTKKPKAPRPRAPKQAEKAPPSRKSVLTALGVAIVATAAVIGASQLVGKKSAPAATPTPVVNLRGIPQTGSVLGSASAKVSLVEYADIQCPGCRFYTENMFPTVVNEYVRPGKVKTEFHGYPFLGADSLKGERFLLAAAEQGKLFNLMEALYRHQGAENSGWLTDGLIRDLAAKIPGLDVERLFARADSADIQKAAEEARSKAEAAGVSGTPTLLVKAGNAAPYEVSLRTIDDLRAALDDALQG